DEFKTAQAIGAGLELTDFHNDSRERTPLDLENLANQPRVLRGGLNGGSWCSLRASDSAGPIKTRCGSLSGGDDWTVGNEPTGVSQRTGGVAGRRGDGIDEDAVGSCLSQREGRDGAATAVGTPEWRAVRVANCEVPTEPVGG